ncbi:MAG: hypothetical protein ACLRSW_05250 [Christensenellaceae bacterium]
MEIRYGRLDATDEVYRSGKLANADDIRRLPGYDSMLTTTAQICRRSGVALSIARAAVADARDSRRDASSIDTPGGARSGRHGPMMQGQNGVCHRAPTFHRAQFRRYGAGYGALSSAARTVDCSGVYYQLYAGAFELE